MRPLTHVAPGALMVLLRDMPLSSGKVELAWSVAVGPAIARATSVKLEGPALLVETTSAEWTREIKRSTSIILKRLQSLLGDDAVTSISIRS
jgi:predicted nucleic acid-binding Zn ribbon protein